MLGQIFDLVYGFKVKVIKIKLINPFTQVEVLLSRLRADARRRPDTLVIVYCGEHGGIDGSGKLFWQSHK